MSLLTVSDLHAGYGRGEVLHGIDLELDAGEVAVVLGANGAGKTTTLRALSGVIASTGRIDLDGIDLGRLSAAKVAAAGVAHVPQGRGTFNELSVEDNLRVGAYLRQDDAAEDIEHWYGIFPRLGERRTQQAGSLSGGEQQMLAIARAMMMRPRVLLLDEPSLGLAPKVTAELFEVLARVNVESGTAMLVVEQNAHLALAIAHRATVLEAGVVAARGSAAEISGDDAVRRAYLGY